MAPRSCRHPGTSQSPSPAYAGRSWSLDGRSRFTQKIVWLVVLILLKNISQWEGLSHIWNGKNMFETTNQNSWHILMDKGVTNRKLNPCTKKLKMRTDTGMDFFSPILLVDWWTVGNLNHPLQIKEHSPKFSSRKAGCIERTKGPIFWLQWYRIFGQTSFSCCWLYIWHMYIYIYMCIYIYTYTPYIYTYYTHPYISHFIHFYPHDGWLPIKLGYHRPH